MQEYGHGSCKIASCIFLCRVPCLTRLSAAHRANRTLTVLLVNAITWLALPVCHKFIIKGIDQRWRLFWQQTEWHLTPLGFSIVAMCAAGNRLVFKVIQVYHSRFEDDLNSNGAIPLRVLPPLCEIAIIDEGIHLTGCLIL